MFLIVGSMAVLAVFANLERGRRSQIETVRLKPAPSSTPQPR
jgi:hypothetical protein